MLSDVKPTTHLGVELQVAALVPASEGNAGKLDPNYLSRVPSDLHHAQMVAPWELGKDSWAFAATSNVLVKTATQCLIITSILRMGKIDVER